MALARQPTVKEMIIMLLEHNMDAEIIVKDKKGRQLHGVTIVVKENTGLGCLFG